MLALLLHLFLDAGGDLQTTLADGPTVFLKYSEDVDANAAVAKGMLAAHTAWFEFCNSDGPKTCAEPPHYTLRILISHGYCKGYILGKNGNNIGPGTDYKYLERADFDCGSNIKKISLQFSSIE